MFVVSLILMTLWIASVLVGFTMGGFVHLLALASVTIVLMNGRRRTPRRA